MMTKSVFCVKLVLLLFASVHAWPSQSNSCPDYWTKIGNNCYKISPGPLTWHDAQQYCAHQGGSLIEIRSRSKQASLNGFLLNDSQYWIGLTDLANEGTFVWQSDFERATNTYTNWHRDQPDNWSGHDDCVHIWGHTHTWNDISCEATNTNEWLTGNIHALCEVHV